MNRYKICVIGSSNTDMVIKTDKLPIPGETKMGGVFYMNMGGKGANQAVAAARLGGNVSFISKVGDDFFGNQTLAGLLDEQIDTSYVLIDKNAASGVALIVVNEEGENAIVVAPGANANLLSTDIETVPTISQAAIILMQLEIPIETICAIQINAKLNHQRVIINPAPAKDLADDLLNGLFLITPNETEAHYLTGVVVSDSSSASAAADILLKKGVKNVVITMGRKGAFFKNKDQQMQIDAPIVQVVDTTAAGDTFNGAIAVAITEGMEWEQALNFAVQAASISVTRLGAMSSIPYRLEIDYSLVTI